MSNKNALHDAQTSKDSNTKWSISMDIYPTVLYIKQHSVTGLKYFGRTTSPDPYKYPGSGKYWTLHIEKHGKNLVDTTWVSEPYTDSVLISEYALAFSRNNNIVASDDWANLVEENGLDGGTKGNKHTDAHKIYMREKLKGKFTFYYPDEVTRYGHISVDDPIIKELGLVVPYTANKHQATLNRSNLAIIANTGSIIYNNGTEERKFKQDPGGEWVAGRLQRTQEHADKLLLGVMKANFGTYYWNNGIVCKKLPKDQLPETGWVRGMLPRK